MTKPAPRETNLGSSIVQHLDQTMVEAYGAETFEEALEVLAHQARLVIGAHQCALSYIPDGNFETAIHAVSLSDKYERYRTYDVMPTGQGIWALVPEQRMSVRMSHEELVSHPRWRDFSQLRDDRGLEHPPMRGWLAVPLLSRKRDFVGVLQLSDKYEGDFSEQDLDLLTHLAALITPTFELRYVQKELEHRTRQLAHEQFLFHALVDNIPDPVFFKDRESRFIRANRAMAHDAGVADPADLIGRTDAEIWSGDLPEQTSLDEQQIIKTGEPIINKEEMPMLEGGNPRWVLVTKMPLRDEAGEIVGTFGIARDITERKRSEEELRETAEALERSNRDLEQFAYVASHDLQEPLRAVAGFTQLLRQDYHGRLDDQADMYVQHAVDGAKRMQTLIDNLLEFSRVGTRTKAFEAVDCNHAFEAAILNLSVAIEESQARVTKDELPTVLGDDSQLVQLLQNLIGNGLKFCHDQPPQIHVSATSHEGEWILAVRDNGIGFAAEHAERIFAIFQRLHTRSEFAGTGIGLAICKRIVERHGGRIWAESEVNQGSAFFFSLPVMK